MYGKIFASLYQGTLRGNAHAILVFTNMIACSDRMGNVDKHPRAIADEVGLTVDEVRAAIAFLEAPDPESRTPTEDGRRLLPLEPGRSWGWRIVTHAKYRAMVREDERREQWRAAQARAKVRKSDEQVMSGDERHQVVMSGDEQVMTGDDGDENRQLSLNSSHAEAEAEAEADANTEREGEAAKAPPPPPVNKGGKLIRILKGQGLPVSEAAVDEWKAALVNRVGVESVDEAADFVEFAIECGKRDGVTVQYPRQAMVYVDAWRARA